MTNATTYINPFNSAHDFYHKFEALKNFCIKNNKNIINIEAFDENVIMTGGDVNIYYIGYIYCFYRNIGNKTFGIIKYFGESVKNNIAQYIPSVFLANAFITTDMINSYPDYVNIAGYKITLG